MAEWVLLIMVAVVTAGTYAFNQRVYESQSLLVWAVAGLIMTVGLIVYIFSKVNRASPGSIDIRSKRSSTAASPQNNLGLARWLLKSGGSLRTDLLAPAELGVGPIMSGRQKPGFGKTRQHFDSFRRDDVTYSRGD